MKAGYLVKHLGGTLVFFGIIFLSAGRFDYIQGLIYLAIGIVMLALNFTVLRIDSDLEKERSKPGDGVKQWDKTILGLSFLATVSMYIIAGLDSGRYNWSPALPWSVCIAGIVLTISGQLLFLVAQKQNKFFSSTVRIQNERGHKVCESGLYRIVRHPAYFGSFIQMLGFPMLFGSYWSAIPVLLSLFLIVLRTYLEDKTLKNELNGYIEYSQKTKFRLLPFIW